MNRLVLCHREILDQQPRHGLEAAGRPEVQAAYEGMLKLALESAERNLQGPWDLVRLSGTAMSRTDLFEQNWRDLRELVRGSDGPVLWLDSDCLVIQPCDPWHWQEFRLFNRTDAPANPRWPIYLNCAVRLFPAGMNDQLWDLPGPWDHGLYDHEQERYNHMFWAGQPRDWHQPHLNYQVPGMRGLADGLRWQDWNGCAWDQVQILHYHGSRGAVHTLAHAQQLWHDLARGLGPDR